MSCWSKEELEQMLEDVVNELNLSEAALAEHGPLGTPPAELVRLVLRQKDLIIRCLRECAMADQRWDAMVAEELRLARRNHRPINSVHEGFAVILEEVWEFWDEVKKRAGQRDGATMCRELVQIAAMAQRTAEDAIIGNEPRDPRPDQDEGGAT